MTDWNVKYLNNVSLLKENENNVSTENYADNESTQTSLLLAVTTLLPDGSSRKHLEEEKWDLNYLWAICLGPLAAVLLISYIVHWYQVIQKIKKDNQMKQDAFHVQDLPNPNVHNRAAQIQSIRMFESQRSEMIWPITTRLDPEGMFYTKIPSKELKRKEPRIPEDEL